MSNATGISMSPRRRHAAGTTPLPICRHHATSAQTPGRGLPVGSQTPLQSSTNLGEVACLRHLRPTRAVSADFMENALLVVADCEPMKKREILLAERLSA